MDNNFEGNGRQPNGSGSMPIYVQASQNSPQKKSILGILGIIFLILALIFSFMLNLGLAGLLAVKKSSGPDDIVRQGDTNTRIALIELSGVVDINMAGYAQEMFDRARKDRAIKGVVLVVDSPGGGVVASDMVRYEIEKYRKATGNPVYVSIQQVGASGAYWFSVAADKIFAQRDSIVGSIGVIYINMVVEQGLKEKLGVEPVIIKSSRSPFKAYGNPFEMPDDEAVAKIQKQLDNVHQRFVDVVSAGRNMDPELVWQLAQGDIFDGLEANANQLTDNVGYLDDVIAAVAQSKGLENYMVVRLKRKMSFVEMMLTEARAGSAQIEMAEQLRNFLRSSSGVQVIDERFLFMQY